PYPAPPPPPPTPFPYTTLFRSQLELLDCKIRCAIETDERAARFDKLAKSLHALLAKTADVFFGHCTFAIAIEDGGAWYNARRIQDRKSTRLNSSHRTKSYAVFC